MEREGWSGYGRDGGGGERKLKGLLSDTEDRRANTQKSTIVESSIAP